MWKVKAKGSTVQDAIRLDPSPTSILLHPLNQQGYPKTPSPKHSKPPFTIDLCSPTPRAVCSDSPIIISVVHVPTNISPSSKKRYPSPARPSVKRRRHHSSMHDELPVLYIDSDSDSGARRPVKFSRSSSGPSAITASQRSVATIGQEITIGTVFSTMDEAQRCIYAREANRGHRWRRGQSKRFGNDPMAQFRKITLRCNHYHEHTPHHLSDIDPSDHRRGKTIKTNCFARVNLNRILDTNQWKVTLTHWDHNHAREFPPGSVVTRPPTKEQRETVAGLATNSAFRREHIGAILAKDFPDHRLQPRQISNMVNKVHRRAEEDIQLLGGDVAAIIQSLQAKIEGGEAWVYKLRLNETQMVIGLWWASPLQVGLLQKYFDILINDSTYNRNRYNYPLNIGVLIDNYGASRNAWYAFQSNEDLESHRWVMQCHLEVAKAPPEVFLSDRHGSLISAVSQTLPLTRHLYCLHHLTGNIMQNVRTTIGSEWDNFNRDFWAAFRAVSPDHFETLWQSLIARYPTAQGYMAEIYDCREHWAWAWVSHVFTAGVRTNGRVEVENRINKALGGPKKTLLQLFNNLNERTNGQSAQEMMKTRDVCKLSTYLRDPTIAHSNSKLCSLLVVSTHKISNLFLLDRYDFFASM